MFLPASTQSAVLLLVVAFVLLGSWANLFKASRWRYELFYFDFTIGALLAALLAAFTLGTLGSDMSFSDRILVAGLRSQALAIAAGFAFGLGNLLLLGSAALVGIAAAFPLAWALAYLIAQGTHLGGGSHLALVAGAVALYLVSAIAMAVAMQRPVKAVPTVSGRKPVRPAAPVTIKAVSVGVLAGISLGIAEPLQASAFWGDLGLGPYAGVLLFTCGLALATLLFNIFLMNIGIAGGRVTLPAYLKANKAQHLFGILGGVVWAGGLVTALAGRSGPQPLPSWTVWLSQGWVLLVAAWGFLRWKEFAGTKSSARTGLIIGCVAFAAALALLSFVPV